MKNLLNSRYHRKKPHMASRLLGFPSWQATKEMIDIFFPDTIYLNELDEKARVEALMNSQGGAAQRLDSARRKKLHDCVLTLLKLRLNYDIQALATIANLCEKTVSEILQRWVPEFGKIGQLLCNLPMPEDLNKLMQSEDFAKLDFNNVYAVGDAKTFRLKQSVPARP